MLMRLILVCWALFVSNLALYSQAEGPLGIPGTTQTIRGYDTELGNDPICWSSVATSTGEDGIPFPNGELVEDFTLADEVKLEPACGNGTWLEAFAPPEFLRPEFRPRTLEWYNYTLKGSINLNELSGLQIASDKGSLISVGVVACDSTTAGFCSPFVHEQANIREANEMEEYGYTLYAKNRIAGDRHGGTHVHAPAVLVEVDISARQVEFEVDVPTRINEPGTFFIVGTLQFFMSDEYDVPRWRYDVANALTLEQNERLVTYQQPAKILEVSSPVRIFSYVAVGLAAFVILYLMVQLVKNYKSQVFQISQAPFLVMFLIAALVATLSSLLIDPKSDMMCLLAYPLIFISLQLMFSTTLGRLWRINAVVSPLLRNRLQRASSKRNINDFLGTCCTSRSNSIRREINKGKVAIIVALCTFPQLVLQMLGLALQPSEKSIEFNADESTGRCVCDDGVSAKTSFQVYSMLLLFVLILVLLAMAHAARQLPSLLNESSVIYDITGTSALLAVLGVGVIAITNDPTVSPDVSYLVHVVIILSMTLNSSIRIMMPKLRMVWRGQPVIVSQLVADHKQCLINSTMKTNPYDVMHQVTGLNINSHSVGSDPTSSFQKPWSRMWNSQTLRSGDEDITESNNHDSVRPEGFERMERETPTSDTLIPTKQLHSDTKSNNNTSSQKVWCNAVPEVSGNQDSEEGLPPDSPHRVNKNKRVKEGKATSKICTEKPPPKILIRESDVPSRRLTVKMLDLQNELDAVTNRIMSGLQVARGDWENVRDSTEQLGEMFSLVHFDWESQREHNQKDEREQRDVQED